MGFIICHLYQSLRIQFPQTRDLYFYLLALDWEGRDQPYIISTRRNPSEHILVCVCISVCVYVELFRYDMYVSIGRSERILGPWYFPSIRPLLASDSFDSNLWNVPSVSTDSSCIFAIAANRGLIAMADSCSSLFVAKIDKAKEVSWVRIFNTHTHRNNFRITATYLFSIVGGLSARIEATSPNNKLHSNFVYWR